MGGLVAGLLAGLLLLLPRLHRRISVPLMVFGGVGALSALVTLLKSGFSPGALPAWLQLAAMAGLLLGGYGVWKKAAWTPTILYAAAAAWVLGHWQYASIVLYPQALFSATGPILLGLVGGVPLLALTAAKCCRRAGDD